MRITECLTEPVGIVLPTESDWLMYSIHRIEAHFLRAKARTGASSMPLSVYFNAHGLVNCCCQSRALHEDFETVLGYDDKKSFPTLPVCNAPRRKTFVLLRGGVNVGALPPYNLFTKA